MICRNYDLRIYLKFIVRRKIYETWKAFIHCHASEGKKISFCFEFPSWLKAVLWRLWPWGLYNLHVHLHILLNSLGSIQTPTGSLVPCLTNLPHICSWVLRDNAAWNVLVRGTTSRYIRRVDIEPGSCSKSWFWVSHSITDQLAITLYE